MTQVQIAASPIKSIVIIALLMLGVASAGADILQNGSSRTGQIHALTVFARFADESDLGEEVPAFAAGIFAAEQPGSHKHVLWRCPGFAHLRPRALLEAIPDPDLLSVPPRRWLGTGARLPYRWAILDVSC